MSTSPVLVLGRHQIRCWVIVLLAVCGALIPLGAAAQDQPAAQAAAPPPVVIPLAGVATALDGAARTGSVQLTLSLYATQDDPTPRWVENQAVTLDSSGRYSVQFGATSADGLPGDLFATGETRWVGVSVNGEPEGARMMLLSVAYASKAAVADSLGGKTAADFVLSNNLGDAVRTALSNSSTTGGGDDTNPNDLTGVGTTGRLVKYTNGALEQVGNSVITESGGNIGINSAAPASALEVAAASGRVEVRSTTGNNAAMVFYTNTGGTAVVGVDNSVGGNFFTGGLPFSLSFLAPGTTRALQFGTNSTARMTISSGGSVGIGTSTPISAFEVVAPSARAELRSTTGTNAAFFFFTNNGGTGVAGVDNSVGGNFFSGGLPFSLGFLAPGTTSSVQFGTNSIARMTISGNGNVGIGTTAPAVKLDVVGAVNVTGDVTVAGNIGAKYQDVAEYVDSVEELEPGTLVVIDRSTTNRVMPSTRAYDSRVAGAVSAQPGVILGENAAGREMVAQSGRVKVKADARYGAIRPGDLLVSSPTKGHVMRSRPINVGGQLIHRPGTLIGKALEALPNGRGEILVLLTLQ